MENVKANDFKKYMNLDGYELVENKCNSFIKTTFFVNSKDKAFTVEIDEFGFVATKSNFKIFNFKQNGVVNRTDGPAKIKLINDKIAEVDYCTNGVEFAGTNVPSKMRFYENGDVKLITYSNANQEVSRTNGPAAIFYNQDGTVEEEFFINGERFTQKQYENLINNVNSKKYLRSLSRMKLSRLLAIRQVLNDNDIVDEALEAKIVALKLEEV